MAKETARENNERAIEKSVSYYNSKVKPITFQVDEWVLLKVQNFLGKNRKLAETFKGPYQITKVNENGMVKMKTKFGKHEQLVNQNLLVKYKQARQEEKEKATQGNETEIPTDNPEIKRKNQK